jgi:hypothetical protein
MSSVAVRQNDNLVDVEVSMRQAVSCRYALQPRQWKDHPRIRAHMSGGFSDNFEHVNDAPEPPIHRRAVLALFCVGS